MELGSIIYPKYITAESIVKHVRALHNSIGSNIETLYRMNNDRVEALEFIVKEDSPVVGIPLLELNLKPNILICCINHRAKSQWGIQWSLSPPPQGCMISRIY